MDWRSYLLSGHIISILLLKLIAMNEASDALEEAAKRQLISIRDTKKNKSKIISQQYVVR
ncbi:MAG: hypothetical protein KAT06_03335 [Gammaproteobacteria bacterium]|nr:hypothetical protein [Gammaproteobacteria bacterium]